MWALLHERQVLKKNLLQISSLDSFTEIIIISEATLRDYHKSCENLKLVLTLRDRR